MFLLNTVMFTRIYDMIYSQLPLYRSRRDLYYLFGITEFRYTGSYINGFEVLGENIHFDMSGYFVISEVDIEGIDCMYLLYYYSIILPKAH